MKKCRFLYAIRVCEFQQNQKKNEFSAVLGMDSDKSTHGLNSTKIWPKRSTLIYCLQFCVLLLSFRFFFLSSSHSFCPLYKCVSHRSHIARQLERKSRVLLNIPYDILSHFPTQQNGVKQMNTQVPLNNSNMLIKTEPCTKILYWRRKIIEPKIWFVC